MNDQCTGTGYRFRIKFRIAKPIGASSSELSLLETPGVDRFAVLTNSVRDRPINEGSWLCIKSRGYTRRDAAERSGRLLVDTLLLAGAERGTGIDVGLDRVLTGTSHWVKAQLAAQGVTLRDDVFGLDVFEDVDVRIAQSELNLSASVDPDRFLESMRDLAPLAAFMDERSRMSARLINDALFPLTTEARLVILMTSIESLWESPKRKASIVALADALLAHLGTLEGVESDKEDVAKQVAGAVAGRVGNG